MRNKYHYLRALLLGGLFAAQACSQHQADLPAPDTSTVREELSIAEARKWYASQASPLTSTTDGRYNAGPLAIDWARASDTVVAAHALVLAPVRDCGQIFSSAGYQSSRYLLVTRLGSTSTSGQVVEILSKDDQKRAKSAQRSLLIDLLKQHHEPANQLGQVFSGFIFFYTQGYQYQAGERYVAGKRQPGTMRLTADAPGALVENRKKTAGTLGCTVYRITSHEPPYNETICTSTPDLGDNDPGQPVFYDPGYGGVPSTPTTGEAPGGGGGTVSGDTPEIREFEEDYRSQMSQSELAIFDKLTRAQQLAYLINARDARDKAQAKFASFTLHNGVGDAFRHAYFVAANTRNLYLGPDLAQRLSTAHEDDPGQPAMERQMDLFNNHAGLLIGLDTGSAIEETVDSWLLTGRLEIIENNQLVPSH